MNLKEMRERLNRLASRMGELAQKTDRTAEEETELDGVIAEFNELAPKCEREIGVQRAAERAATMQQSAGRVAGVEALANGGNGGEGAQANGNGARETVDRRSIGQRFAESDEVRQWLAGSGGIGIGSGRFKAGRIPGSGPALTYGGDGPIDRLTLIESGVFPSFMPAPQVMPEIVRPRDYALTMRQVILNGRTTTDTVYFVRENVFTNNAAETAQASSFDVGALGSSGRKPESALTFEQDSAAVKTIAHWVPITRQAIADVAQLQSYVEGRLLVGVERRLNSQIAAGDGTGENLTGILSTTGVLDLDDAWFSTATPALNDVGTPNERFNRIARAMSVIEIASDAMATFVALHPYDLETIRTSTNANRDYLGQSPFVAGPIPTIWGLPVAKDRAITQGTALVGDGTAAMVFDREDANILIGWINDMFVRNLLAILAEGRYALAVFRPTAFAAVDISI